jgi:hypothetical protein
MPIARRGYDNTIDVVALKQLAVCERVSILTVTLWLLSSFIPDERDGVFKPAWVCVAYRNDINPGQAEGSLEQATTSPTNTYKTNSQCLRLSLTCPNNPCTRKSSDNSSTDLNELTPV